VMEEVSGRPLGGFFRQWVYSPSQPEITGSWSFGEGVLTVEIRQVQAGETLFETPLDIGIVAKPGLPPRIETVTLDGRVRSFAFNTIAGQCRQMKTPAQGIPPVADWSVILTQSAPFAMIPGGAIR